MWIKHDFDVNSYYWLHRGYADARPIRTTNLLDLSIQLENANIPFWLQGKTLYGLFKKNDFLDDHDDALGVRGFRTHGE